MIYFLNREAVLSVVMSSTGEQCFSGGVDGTIQCWNTPNPNIDPYDSYGNRVLCFYLLKSDDFHISDMYVVFLCRPLGAAGSVVWTYWRCLGFSVQQCSPAPPLLLCRRDSETLGCQHNLPLSRSVQWRQKYWLQTLSVFISLDFFIFT